MTKTSYRYIGKAIPRKDARDIVTGNVRFVDDIKFAGLLHGKVLRSPHPHANIKRIDKRRALELKGVKAILTWKDIPDWKGGTPAIFRVLDKKVRYVGDAVALVAATTKNIAREALELIDVEYEVLPAVYDAEEALQPDAPQLYDELPGNVVTPGAFILGPKALTDVVMGDVQEGFAEADIITEGTCSYENMPNPIPAETPGVVALWENPNKVTLWPISQHPSNSKLFFPATDEQLDIRVHGNPCGGGFGSRGRGWDTEAHAVLLSRAAGQPVKIILTREEHLATFGVRISSRIKAKVGMKKDGTVTAVSGKWFVNTGYHSSHTQFMIGVGCGEVQIAIRCPNWDLKPVIVCTNRIPTGPARGFGGQELKSAFLPLLSLAMAKADIDPLSFFKKNFIKPGDGYFWRDGRWYNYRGPDFMAAMEKGAAQFGWHEKWKGWLKPTSVSSAKRRGIGVGIHGNADIGEDSSEVYVQLHPFGTAVINSNIVEIGNGQRSNYIKMVAEVLQLPYEKVSMSDSDTMFNPYEFGPAGSRGTYAIGSAMIAAAEDARKKILELSMPALNAELDELDTVDGFIYKKNEPDSRIPWIQVMDFDRVCTGLGRFEPDFTLSNCMICFVEVEVDTETGKVTLAKVVNATDVGQIIDPLGIQGQLNGCLGTAGIDSALFEETILDPKIGRVMNANMIDYKWRTFAELPKIDNVILETPFPSHRFKAVGVGEIATSPGPAAVLMAVSNALGFWMHNYPLTPDKILKALSQTADKGRA